MPSFKIIGLPVLEKKIFEVFFTIYVYGRGGNLGLVTWAIYKNFLSHFPRRLHMKFGFDWLWGFEKKSFENIGHRHIYNPGAGADNPLG